MIFQPLNRFLAEFHELAAVSNFVVVGPFLFGQRLAVVPFTLPLKWAVWPFPRRPAHFFWLNSSISSAIGEALPISDSKPCVTLFVWLAGWCHS